MKMKDKVTNILALLDEYYPTENKCYLHYDENKPWQLLFATILSAQCTDDRVNIVTKELFQKYKTLEDFAHAEISEMEKDIYSTGFYHNKAKNIVLSARILSEEYAGIAPSDIELLIKLPGVGRKTANVYRGHIHNSPSIVVDTHVKRISKKLGLTQNDNPEKIEFDLYEILPENHWIRYNTQIIAHGRKVCMARKPNCEVCFLNEYCVWYMGKPATGRSF